MGLDEKSFNIGVIPAAGLATRFKGYFYHGILPKSLYPVAGKPLIEYQLKIMEELNVSLVYLIVNSQEEILRKYISTTNHRDLRVELIRQSNLDGLGGAILTVSNLVDQPFVVVLGDDVTIASNLSEMSHNFWESNFSAVQVSTPETDRDAISRACGISIDSHNVVTDIVEKPIDHDFDSRGIGLYFFKNDIFEVLKSTPKISGELRLTDALGILSKKRKLGSYKLKGLNYNINTVNDLFQANSRISPSGNNI